MAIQSARTSPATDPFAAAAAKLGAQKPLRNPRLREIESDLQRGEAESAEVALGGYLDRHPSDVDANYLMARVQLRLGRRLKAASALRRCLDFAPSFIAVRFNYATLLVKLARFSEALNEFEHLLKQDPGNPLVQQMKADVLATIGRSEEALVIFQQLAAQNPGRAECWLNYGHALRAVGDREKSVAAYRKAIECRPSFGLAYWGLANIKTFRFTDADVEAMEGQLIRPNIPDTDRTPLQFSLAKAYEDRRLHDRSFEQYARANAAMRVRVHYDPDVITKLVAASKALFTPAFVQTSRGGCRATDPVFVLSLPRSGSTLIEQILSSHSAIEATAELPYLPAIIRRLEETAQSEGGKYPEMLKGLSPDALRALGEEYLESVQVHRQLGRPFFVDKQPSNWLHVGLVHLIFPNAKIIDVRRHPAACSLSVFKHYFSTARPRLAELGQVYRDYVSIMAHFDSVLPGRIHRVVYERLVSEPKAEIQRLLDYLGLPFQDSCLKFYETERTVLTPSVEQVRRPISTEAVDHWRNYEPWLGPLLNSLGSVLSVYPSVPDDLKPNVTIAASP